MLPRLLKGPQNHVLSTNAQAAAFPLVIAYVDRLTRLPAFCAGRVQTWLFWRPGILPKYVVPFLELAGNWRNRRYGPSVTRFPAKFVDAAVADASAARLAARRRFDAPRTKGARPLLVLDAEAPCVAARLIATELLRPGALELQILKPLERLAPPSTGLAARLAGQGLEDLPLLVLQDGAVLRGAGPVAEKLAALGGTASCRSSLESNLEAAAPDLSTPIAADRAPLAVPNVLSARDRAVCRRWCYWARSVDNDLLRRAYASKVAPRRLVEVPRGLPGAERALARRRFIDAHKPWDAASCSELSAQLDALEETLAAEGALVPASSLTLADCFVFAVVECARACGAAPASSILAAPRPNVAAWRRTLLARPAFRDAAAAVAAAWAPPEV